MHLLKQQCYISLLLQGLSWLVFHRTPHCQCNAVPGEQPSKLLWQKSHTYGAGYVMQKVQCISLQIMNYGKSVVRSETLLIDNLDKLQIIWSFQKQAGKYAYSEEEKSHRAAPERSPDNNTFRSVSPPAIYCPNPPYSIEPTAILNAKKALPVEGCILGQLHTSPSVLLHDSKQEW